MPSPICRKQQFAVYARCVPPDPMEHGERERERERERREREREREEREREREREIKKFRVTKRELFNNNFI